MHPTIEIGGLLFTNDAEGIIKVDDINYDCYVGALTLEDGPGWVLNVKTSFLDGGQLRVLADAVNRLNEDIE